MSCNNCNKIVDCGCNTKENCVQQDCSCPIKDFPTDCIKYTGPDLECSGIESDIILTDLIQQLDEFICEKFDFATNYFQLINVGGGAEVYKGVNLSGAKEIRSITKTGDLIVVSQNTNDINITIDEDELIDFVGGNESLYDVSNLSDGAEVYKDSVTVGNTTTFNLRSLKSDTLVITENEDDITIETNLIELQDFIVDTRYAGETYEEKGTYAKPFKNLDNAIVAYIDAANGGTRQNPVNAGARILCIGGQSHSFQENLSINRLILEVERGTTIVYNGTDLYPIDFRPLQALLGGYGNQTDSIRITLQGEGNFDSTKLIAYAVNSGGDVATTNRIPNILNIEGLRIYSKYKLSEVVVGVKRSDSTPWITNNKEASFYFGGVEESAIIAEGFSETSPIKDNNNSGLMIIKNAQIISLTQQTIKVNSAYVSAENATLLNSFGSVVVADDTAYNSITNILTESPLGTYNLPNYKENMCLVEINGTGHVFLKGGHITQGFEIGVSEAWFILNSNKALLDITEVNNTRQRGAIIANNFIKVGSNTPEIRMDKVTINREVIDGEGFIKTSVDPYTRATVKDCDINNKKPNNVDLTKGNTISVTNTFNNKVKESLQKYASRELAVAGGLVSGDIFINRKSINAVDLVEDEEYQILTIGTTDFTLHGAASNTVGLNFTANGVTGVGTGTVYSYKRDIIL